MVDSSLTMSSSTHVDATRYVVDRTAHTARHICSVQLYAQELSTDEVFEPQNDAPEFLYNNLSCGVGYMIDCSRQAVGAVRGRSFCSRST